MVYSEKSEILNQITQSILFENIINTFYNETYDDNLMEKIFWFLTNLVEISIKEKCLNDRKIKELIRISSGLLFYQNEEILDFSLEILKNFIGYELDFIKKMLIEEGILNKILRLLENYQSKYHKDIDPEKKEIKKRIYKILDFFGIFISIHSKDEEVIEVK